MNRNYRLERKTVTASLGILALSLGILSNVSAADIKARPVTNLVQLAQSEEDVSAHLDDLAASISDAVKSKTYKLPDGWQLKIKSLTIKRVGQLEVKVTLNGRLRKKNPVNIPGNKYTSITGKIGVRFGVKAEGGQLCTTSASVTSLNFKNVQNDVEQSVKDELNEELAKKKICVLIKNA